MSIFVLAKTCQVMPKRAKVWTTRVSKARALSTRWLRLRAILVASTNMCLFAQEGFIPILEDSEP